MSDKQMAALQLLFNPGESAVFTHLVNVQSSATDALKPAHKDFEFVTLNPIFHGKPRSSMNVFEHRNFLVEWDGLNLSAEGQLAHAQSFGLPFSLAIFSGNKSVHFVICLTAAVDLLAHKKIAKALVAKAQSDKSVTDGARLFRFPGGFRREKNTEQKVMEVRSRVDLSEVLSWLGPEVATETNIEFKQEPRERFFRLGNRRLLAQTELFLQFGSVPGNFNANLFAASCNLFECFWPFEKILIAVGSINGWLDDTDIKTICSAYQKIYESRPSQTTIFHAIKAATSNGIEYRKG